MGDETSNHRGNERKSQHAKRANHCSPPVASSRCNSRTRTGSVLGEGRRRPAALPFLHGGVGVLIHHAAVEEVDGALSVQSVSRIVR